MSAARYDVNCVRAMLITPFSQSATPGKGNRRMTVTNRASIVWPRATYLVGGRTFHGSLEPAGLIAAGGIGSSDQGAPSESNPPTWSRWAELNSASVATTRHTHSRRVIVTSGRRTRRLD